MKKVVGTVRTRKAGSTCEFEFYIDDGHSEEDIEEMAMEAMSEEIEWNYEIKEVDE